MLNRPPHPHPRATTKLAGLALLCVALAGGCQWDLDPEEDVTVDAAVDGMGGQMVVEGTLCDTDNDCLDICPEYELGCACGAIPEGSYCVPACTVPTDCPAPPPGSPALLCDQGACVPPFMPPAEVPDGGMMPPPLMDGGMMPPPIEDGGMMPPPLEDGGMMPPPMNDGGMMGPMSCEGPEDCDGACPPEAVGCTCSDSTMGSICVPTCEADEDCPAGAMGEALTCNLQRGVCVPAGAMMPGGGGMMPPP